MIRLFERPEPGGPEKVPVRRVVVPFNPGIPRSMGKTNTSERVRTWERIIRERYFMTEEALTVVVAPPIKPARIARLAQLDRASASGAEGHRFESCVAYHGRYLEPRCRFFIPESGRESHPESGRLRLPYLPAQRPPVLVSGLEVQIRSSTVSAAMTREQKPVAPDRFDGHGRRLDLPPPDSTTGP